MMLMDASCPSKRLAAVTNRTGCCGVLPVLAIPKVYDRSCIAARRPATLAPMDDVPAAHDPIGEARRQWLAHELGEPLAMTAAISVIRASQIVNTAVDRALRPLGLSFARYEVLMLLSFSRKGCLPITKIGDRLMVHPTGVSKLVDKLE